MNLGQFGKRNANYKHGGVLGGKMSRLYRIWCCMKSRCANKKNRWYGGRGISVCEPWKQNFSVFEKWALKTGYHDSLSIERKNNNGSYSPRNCVWVTHREQCNNMRSNLRFRVGRDLLTLAEIARKFGMPYRTIQSRLRYGFPIEKAVLKYDFR